MPTTTVKIPARLMHGRAVDVRAGRIPVLPEWYPMDRQPRRDETGEIVETFPPYTDAERRNLRREKALTEALRGPYDGQNVVVEFSPADGPPPLYVPINTPEVWYALDAEQSTRHRLVYRYSLDSPMHAAAMRAVEDGFAEAGRDYTVAAREEDRHDRTTPS